MNRVDIKVDNKIEFEIDRSLHYIKYMGSKTKILPFIVKGIEKVYDGGYVCDLFSGSCSLAGAIGRQVPMVSNDIQNYSSVMANTYLLNWNDKTRPVTSKEIVKQAIKYHNRTFKAILDGLRYTQNLTLSEFAFLEERNQQLIHQRFTNRWHLFTKNYSGTWWSAEQCTWIDSIRKVIEDHKEHPAYHAMLSALMFALAYTSQGTGHYAQYRDAKTESSMKDIQMYRCRNITDYFVKKLDETLGNLPDKPSSHNHIIVSKDYLDCLREVKNSTVYADPPYCFVHYSRFYHAIETLVLYDYPKIQVKGGQFVKGRYREDRHQSPFCITTKVKPAFEAMFKIVAENRNSLVLSYSDSGMISLEEILELARNNAPDYDIQVESMEHTHMTMGRYQDRDRDVKELLILMKLNNG